MLWRRKMKFTKKILCSTNVPNICKSQVVRQGRVSPTSNGSVVMQVRPLTDELAEVARVELNEDPRQTEECLRSLKEWIRKQPHLKARTDDQWLIAFLRGGKWSLERTKEKLDIYYSLRSCAPDLFCLKHTDPKVMDILDKGVALVLPKVTSPTAPRIVLIRPGCYDPDQYNIMEIMAVTAIQQQISYLEDDNLMVSGSINVVDLQGIKLSHFISMTPLQMKKMVTLNQEAAPTRLKGIHVLNMPPFFETFLNMAKLFLNEKNRVRLHVHSNNYEDLYKHIPKNILPKEFGGNDCTVQEIIDYWKKKYRQYHEWLEEDLEYGTVESMRSANSKACSINEAFGIQGSFKKLDFD